MTNLRAPSTYQGKAVFRPRSSCLSKGSSGNALYHPLLGRNRVVLVGGIISVLVFLVVLVTQLLIGFGHRHSDGDILLFSTIKHNHKTCQVTAIFPFRTGCPKECKRAVGDEPMYRLTIEWYFGRPDQPAGTAYEKGINYQCPERFVENFRNASRFMESIQTMSQDVNVNIQKRIHMSLSYLCCLRRNETDWAREIMYQWVLDNNPFSFNVNFDKLECWHERYNSVTIIIVADDASQRTMMKMNKDLERKLQAKGIAVEIDRSQQMPFHTTLFGVFRGEKESYAPEHDIRGDIPHIYSLVTNVSDTIGNQWTGGKQMLVQHAPYFQFIGGLHAGEEPE